eukprot:1177500-Prorocentrum_minimum.AAC.5
MACAHHDVLGGKVGSGGVAVHAGHGGQQDERYWQHCPLQQVQLLPLYSLPHPQTRARVTGSIALCNRFSFSHSTACRTLRPEQ